MATECNPNPEEFSFVEKPCAKIKFLCSWGNPHPVSENDTCKDDQIDSAKPVDPEDSSDTGEKQTADD